MNVSNKNIIKPKTGRLKKSQRGMTLVEVLVSMFVLAVGVLALLATQLRTVASVQEAESQTVVAQAVQNLMESMLINPTLCSKDDKDDPRCAGKVDDNTPENWVVKSYDNNKIFVDDNGKPISYRYSNPVEAKPCSGNNLCRSPDSTSLNKREILEDQLGRFEDSLSKALPNANVWYIICNDNSGKDMTISGSSVTHHCSGNESHPFVIKVLWEMEAEKIKDNKALTQNNKKIVYTYQARLAE
ncbi:type IV pilus modification protein PilV [Neisseria dumasiana]|uniref:Type IV pilus modification protein PilV n=1 Tax=Neisseria dumasiana TaxID=1931275 RepID=A0ABX3WNT8_9NEIS|nr:type IV pilus modification protein PilV [Neisseria dumasiana]OSI35619.1 type IV pilus modification protein PilV [Neisseria dumasiana]UOO84919.1 type IV pilus modification protein PilV [Neisseria dumasiana]